MRVALVCPRYHPNIVGGGEISLKLFAETLAKTQDVHVFSFDKTPSLTSMKINGVNVSRLRSVGRIRELKTLNGIFRLLPYLKEFDIFHAYNMHYLPSVGFLGRSFGIKTVATLNDYTYFPPELVGNPIKHWSKRLYFFFSNPLLLPLIKQIDRFVCISHTVKTIYAINGFDPDKLLVIPNMLDERYSKLKIKRSYGQLVRLLYVGRLEPNKGVEYLIHAFNLVKHEPFSLWIVGGGSQKAYLTELVKKLKLTDRVSFFNSIKYEDVFKAYALCDLFVHPAIYHEPLGRTILEAIQAKLPVIATNIGGPADLLPDCWLFQPKSQEALAAKLKETINELGYYKLLLQPVRKWVLETFSSKSITSQYMKLYEGCLND